MPPFSISLPPLFLPLCTVPLYIFFALSTEIPCFDKIYVMAFTSDVQSADSDDGHAIRVVISGQNRQISLPDLQPGDDQTLNKGDLWKLDFVSDFGFFPATCPKYGLICSYR